MTNIKIFEGNKTINLPTLIDSRLLICANSGGGKSYAVRKLLEETHGKVMAIVLDIEGEFKTLREKYDFLLIGENGDVPLNQKAVSLLPRKLLELNVSTIIDVSDLKRHERILYVKKFLESLMELPRKGNYWKPCLVILDEIHQLAGQQEKQDSTFAVIDLATRGRKRGYCLVGCTQRISKLHKDVVAELNNYMVGRTGLDIDQKRAGDILGFTNKQDVLSLRDLDAGQFFVFGTAISKAVIKVKVGEVNTTHPKVGMDLKGNIVPPTPKIKEMLSKLSELPKEAEEEIKTTQDMQKKIRELTTKLRIVEHSKPEAKIDEIYLERIKKQGFMEGEREQKKQALFWKQEYDKFGKALSKIYDLSQPSINKEKYQKPIIQEKPIVSPIRNITKPIIKEETISDGEYNLNLCAKKIYSLLAQYPERSFSKSQIGVFTGYSHKSGGFSNAVSNLRSLDLVEGSGNDLKVKVVNQDIIQEFDFSKEAIISKLSKCEKEIYNVLLENPYEEYTKEGIAELTLTNYSANSGGFSNAISRLNTLGVLERNSGKIKLNPELLEI